MTVAGVVAAAAERGLIDESDTAVIAFDLDVLERQVHRVRAAFPETAWHAIAVKTNPLVCVLRELADMGVFAEAASAEELAIARAAGFGDRCVWDSPAKTELEIAAHMIQPPRLVNVDSLSELARYGAGDVKLGLRVNPELRPDTINALATGVSGSKFGVAISDRETIVDAYEREPRLTAIHVHSGSNSRSLEPMVAAVERTVALADEVNARRSTSGQIDTVDIGGGLKSTLGADEELSVERYAELLAQRVPALFDGTYRVVTEFGRFHHLAAGATASRVEYVSEAEERRHVVVHVGADSFVREVYDADNWRVEFEGHGPVRPGDTGFDVVGPLCFEGDVIARAVGGSTPSVGDWLIARNTGANTFSLWSRHCSRVFPTVLLYRSSDVDASLRVGKRRERVDDVVAFWS
ncbi:MAG: diaminopimelate decarboxylase [Ilumatobacter sp.]